MPGAAALLLALPFLQGAAGPEQPPAAAPAVQEPGDVSLVPS